MATDNVDRPSPQQGPATPYYFPGGTAAGTTAPAGWYSTPWWRAAATATGAIAAIAVLQQLPLGG